MSFLSKVAKVVAAPFTGGASLVTSSKVDNAVGTAARFTLAPVTGGMSLAQNRAQALRIGEVQAGAVALTAGAIAAPGAAALAGKALTGAAAASALRRFGGRVNPPPSLPTPGAVAYSPLPALSSPSYDSINPSVNPPGSVDSGDAVAGNSMFRGSVHLPTFSRTQGTVSPGEAAPAAPAKSGWLVAAMIAAPILAHFLK